MARPPANAPAWTYIEAALTKARAVARRNGYAWTGESCYIVSALALRIIIETREGKRGVPTQNPQDIQLAYADHYLHMRGISARHPSRAPLYRMKAAGYDGLKRFAARSQRTSEYERVGVDPASPHAAVTRFGGQVVDRLLREGRNPLSEPTAESLDWANAGADDGIADANRNQSIDNDPDTGSWSLEI
jgi:hypothetical protein